MKLARKNLDKITPQFLPLLLLLFAAIWWWWSRSISCPPLYFDAKDSITPDYHQLLWIYSYHQESLQHPVTLFVSYLVLTLAWTYFAKGTQKLWALIWAVVTVVGFFTFFGAGLCDATTLKHLRTHSEPAGEYHLFKSMTLSSGQDVYRERLHLAKCVTRSYCEYEDLPDIVHDDKINWRISEEELEVLVNDKVMYNHPLDKNLIQKDGGESFGGVTFEYTGGEQVVQCGNESKNSYTTYFWVTNRAAGARTLPASCEVEPPQEALVVQSMAPNFSSLDQELHNLTSSYDAKVENIVVSGLVGKKITGYLKPGQNNHIDKKPLPFGIDMVLIEVKGISPINSRLYKIPANFLKRNISIEPINGFVP